MKLHTALTMDKRTTNHQPSNDGAGASRTGQAVPAQDETQDPAPQTPHERDESAASQAPREASGARLGQQAHDDLQRGRVDTDKGPPMDAAYEKMRDKNEPATKPRK
jgi:hypothetical protein